MRGSMGRSGVDDRGRRLRLAVAASVAVATVLTACGGSASSGSSSSGSGGQNPAASAAAFDPPTKFDTSKGIALPAGPMSGKISMAGMSRGVPDYPLPVSLYRTRAYLASTENLQVVDTRSGTVRGILAPHYPPAFVQDWGMGQSPTAAPVITQVGGRHLVLTPFVVTLKGSGTTPDRRMVELMAVDADSGQQAWTGQITLGTWASETTDVVAATAIGVADQLLVVGVTDGVTTKSHRAAYGFDLAGRRVVWTHEDFEPATVTGEVVVGEAGADSIGNQQVTGVSVRDGRQLWQLPTLYSDMELEIQPGGPSLIALGAGGLGRMQVQLLDAATGKQRSVLAEIFSGLRCWYDDRSTTVCTGESSWVSAFDAGQKLWELPDKAVNRIAPTVTCAWHGLVYGSTANGPLTLDARTGQDRSPSVGAAPVTVDEYGGVAVPAKGEDVFVYPAVG